MQGGILGSLANNSRAIWTPYDGSADIKHFQVVDFNGEGATNAIALILG